MGTAWRAGLRGCRARRDAGAGGEGGRDVLVVGAGIWDVVVHLTPLDAFLAALQPLRRVPPPSPSPSPHTRSSARAGLGPAVAWDCAARRSRARRDPESFRLLRVSLKSVPFTVLRGPAVSCAARRSPARLAAVQTALLRAAARRRGQAARGTCPGHAGAV